MVEACEFGIYNRPEDLHLSSFRLHTSTLVGSKVFVIGKAGQARHGTRIGICDLQKQMWKWVDTSDRNDLYVKAHVSFLVDDFLYIHGGTTTTSDFSPSMYRLDLTTLEWTKCLENGQSPCPPRKWHAGEYIEETRMYVGFGGLSKYREYPEKVWAVRIDGLTRIDPVVTGEGPSGRRGLRSCNHRNNIFFFGGECAGSQVDGDLYVLKCGKARFMWSRIKTGLNVTRTFCSMCFMNGRIYVFAGFDEAAIDSDDLFVLDVRRSRYQRAVVLNSANVVGFGPKYGHSAVVSSNKMYVIHGFRSEVRTMVFKKP